MLAVRTIGTMGWTRENRAETHPVSASAASTTTKVTSALDGPGINMMASQGSTAPAAKAVLTANASRNGAMREAAVMPYSASAWAASASWSDHGTREYLVNQGDGEQESGVARAERAAKQLAAPVLPQPADEQAAGANTEAGGEEDAARGAGQDPGLDQAEDADRERERERR
jgi:hypothetical protein